MKHMGIKEVRKYLEEGKKVVEVTAMIKHAHDAFYVEGFRGYPMTRATFDKLEIKRVSIERSFGYVKCFYEKVSK